MRDVQRLTSYGVVRVDDRVALVRASSRSDLAGRWFLPGGGVDHGEHPEAAVVREVAEETGLDVQVRRLRTVVDDVLELPHRGVRVHTVRLVYDVDVVGGLLRAEPDGTSDAVRLVTPEDAAGLPVVPHVARVLGLPEAAPERPVAPAELVPLSGLVRDLRPPAGARAGERSTGTPPPGAGTSPPGAGTSPPGPMTPGGPDAAAEPAPGSLRVRQRLAAYGLAERGEGLDAELLLALFDPRDGRPTFWTLPGGGVDHGEPVADALVREVHEETGLTVRGCRLLGVVSRHFTGAAPDGVVEDYHGVGIVYRVDVGPEEPRVVEVDGTTAAARWVPLAELPGLPTVSLVGAARRLAAPPTVEP